MVSRPGSRATALALWAVVGCSQVLGIEDSFVDPALEPQLSVDGQGGRGAAGSSGAASLGGALGDEGPSSAGSERVADGGAPAGAGGRAQTSCEQYCDLMGELCVGDALQYRDAAQCLRICAALPAGAINDDRVNSASCRRRYAGKARYLAGVELATTCRYAGPGGDGRCGSNCEGLCSIAMAACGPGLSDPYFYESIDDCLRDCADLPAAPYQYGKISSGNSLECRLFHASSAIMADADEHCEHTLGISLCAD